MTRLYKILTPEGFVHSTEPGIYAGYKLRRYFGLLDCKTGMLMHKENRVFFHTLDDAIRCNYRPCQKCKPMHWEEFEELRERSGLGPWHGPKPKQPY